MTNLLKVEPQTLNKRGLTKETCTKWGYGVSSFNGQPVQVAQWYKDGEVVGQKVRLPGKDFIAKGDIDQLYGQWLWAPNAKLSIVVTEGELDALSVSQAQDLRWPVVSVPNGAQGAPRAVRRALKYLEGFAFVVFMFDSDEPGSTAAVACAKLLTPGKAKIAHLPLKDASEMLQHGRAEELRTAVWTAIPYRPDGILSGAEVLADMFRVETWGLQVFPHPKLNELTLGARGGEIVTLVAGAGVGKTLFISAMVSLSLDAYPEEKWGYVSLEERVGRTAMGLVSMKLGKPLHLLETLSKDEMVGPFEEVVGSEGNERVFFYDHHGSLDSETLIANIRYMIVGCGAQNIILDPISVIVASQKGGDERRNLDNFMADIRALAGDTGARLFLVTHLRKPQSPGYDEGRIPTLSEIRSSSGPELWSNTILGLSRNIVEDESVLHLHVLKNRHTGRTGQEVGFLRYDRETGLLIGTDVPEEPAFEPVEEESFEADPL